MDCDTAVNWEVMVEKQGEKPTKGHQMENIGGSFNPLLFIYLFDASREFQSALI